MTSKYRSYFSDVIWARGNAYVNAGKVQSIKQAGSKWIANVRGSSPYVVTFSTNPVTITCSCPYADEGHRCKHMAAALVAYENASNVTTPSKTKTVKKSKSLEDYDWFRFVAKSINAHGKVDDVRLFRNGIDKYFESIEGRDSVNYKNADDILMLLNYMNSNVDGYYYWLSEIYMQCIEKLGEIRPTLEMKNKEKLDKSVNEMLQNADSDQLVKNIVDYYFIEDSDYDKIEEFLKKHSQAGRYVTEVMKSIEKHNVEKEKLEQLCLKFIGFKVMRTWLSSFYKKSEQYDKGIQLLENFIKNDNGIDTHEEQLALFGFYVKTSNTRLIESNYTELLRNRKVKKDKLFKLLKEGMCKEEWNSTGKTLVKNWAKGKNLESSFEVFQAINAGDLMIDKMIVDGFDLQMLKKYSRAIASYDEGMLFAFFKVVLKNQIDIQPSSVKWILSGFFYNYPKTENSLLAFKIMLIEFQEEYKNNDVVRTALEEREEELYEEERN